MGAVQVPTTSENQAIHAYHSLSDCYSYSLNEFDCKICIPTQIQTLGLGTLGLVGR